MASYVQKLRGTAAKIKAAFAAKKLPQGVMAVSTDTLDAFIADGQGSEPTGLYERALRDAKAYVDAKIKEVKPPEIIAVPAGCIAAFCLDLPPDGWLSCSGQWLKIAEYPALFAAIGKFVPNGDNQDFKIPDMRGNFVRGWLAGRDPGGVGSLLSQKGRPIGHEEEMQLVWHQHSGGTDWGGEHSHAAVAYPQVGGAGGDTAFSYTSTLRPLTDVWVKQNGGHTHHFTTDGGLQPGWNLFGNEVRPRNVALRYCIKT